MAIGSVTNLVARELRADLARRRMTAAELARRARLDPSTVARIVRGAQAISLDHYAAIVAALNSSPPDDVGRALVIEMHAHAMRGSVDVEHAAHRVEMLAGRLAAEIDADIESAQDDLDDAVEAS